MEQDVRKFVRDCIQCARNSPAVLQAAPWGTLVHAKVPGEVLHMDFLAVDLRTEQECKYVLVLKDDLSHWVDLVPVKRARAVDVVNAMIKWCSWMKVPRVVVTDQGAQFRNKLMKELSKAMRFRHKFTFPYSPWSNGTVERVNREIIKLLRSFCSEFQVRCERWCEILPLVQYALNTTLYDSLGGLSPAEVVTGRKASTPLEFVLCDDTLGSTAGIRRLDAVRVKEQVEELRKRLEEIHKVVDDKRLEKHLKNIEGVGVDNLPRFDIGDYVLVARRVRGTAPKLQVVWKGPHVIVGTVHGRVYKVKRLGAEEETAEEVHVRRLRRYADPSLNVTERLVKQAHYDEGEFVVEEIVGWKADDDQEVQLLIKWFGYGAEWATWEPIASLYKDIPVMTRNYVARHVHESEVVKHWLRSNASGAV